MAIGPREGVLLGHIRGAPFVTNGNFMAYVCDSAAMRPSSQITLGRLVIIMSVNIYSGVFVMLQDCLVSLERLGSVA